MKSYNKILLLGSTGFIGSGLIQSPLFSSYQFLLPIRNKNYIGKTIKNLAYIDIEELTKQDIEKSEIIIYMLDDITLLKNSIEDIENYIGLKYLEFIVDNMKKNQHIIFLSSRMVYDPKNNIPVKETSKLFGRNIYSNIKIKQEKLIIELSTKKKFQYSILRATNVYTTEHSSKARNIINVFVNNILKNKPLSIYGTGNQVRDYVNIKYLLIVIYYLIENSKENNIFNVGSNAGVTINEIVNFIQNSISKPLTIKKVDITVDESTFVADCTKIQKIIPYSYDLYEDIIGLLKDADVK